VLQSVLFIAVGLSALAGRDWPAALHAPAIVAGVALMVLGLALVLAGAAELGPAMTPMPKPRSGTRLSQHGVHARARHPMYGGVILVAAGWSTIFASVAGAILTVILELFFELKSRHEETLLEEQGADYAEYRERTPRRFLPWLY
jgi:protein-S-isoprenylcysteine O-methyltransferase Ste14